MLSSRKHSSVAPALSGVIAGLFALAAMLTAVGSAEAVVADEAEAYSSSGGMMVLGARAYVPGEVVVGFRDGRDRTLDLPAKADVARVAARLEQRPRVRYAAPNHIARASSYFLPRDSGHLRALGRPPASLVDSITPDAAPRVGRAGGWISRQWNFLPWREGSRVPTSAGGIDAVGGWQNLIRARRPGARGITVAVIDTGIAYRNVGRRYRRNPDFDPRRFVRGYDFVLGNRLPLDRNGHGTHIAGTIGQQTDNAIGSTGLAYNARLMPVRVLDREGHGTSDRIAAGIRFAADRGAHVINMSFNFNCGDRVPNVEAAVRYALRRGVLLVGSVGNTRSEGCVAPPASIRGVVGVGGTTEGGCLGAYSPDGPGVDLVAPGGGLAVGGYGCDMLGTRPILQLTFLRSGSYFRHGFPSRYFGTSMAAAHVSGAAAMVLASGAAGRGGTRVVLQRLQSTARGPTAMPRLPGFGAGILDVGTATDRRFPPPRTGTR